MLFASFACYLDDASGAAVACRAMMEALARRGLSVEVVSGPVLERAVEVDLSSWLAARGLPFDVQGGDSWDVGALGWRSLSPRHLHLGLGGVPIGLLLGSTLPHVPSGQECRQFLRLFEEVCARGRPDVVISYGGGPLTREVFRGAKTRVPRPCSRSTTSGTRTRPLLPTSTRYSSPPASRPNIIGWRLV